MVIPFAPSTAWVREYLRLTASGTDNTEAASLASASTGISGKQYARCAISTGTLTVPVAGGAGTLKRRGADPVLSEHGKWRREHLGAWSAAYGRCAYHTHLMPEIETVYTASEGMTLGEFNWKILQTALEWIDTAALREGDHALLERIRDERSGHVSPQLSIFDALFRLGRETLFVL